ncbi:response regulator [Adhaeribacter rhizoryzae]|uniref:Response regulator n=1 Tax=Adhaeribacter rhizoryzae TaxID=2607907 RepID=A0A5M6DP33_9BACT|nr:response regulator [Adhaeribacter rhizoryzae]KAA5549193.1 response regulator [Adhaeribacter rhizoryzae]
MRPLDLILLIDDDETTNHVNLRTLKRTNIAKDIKIFMNGEQALHYLKAIAAQTGSATSEEYPDLIFLDIKMPIMDGFEFLDAYQELHAHYQIPAKIMMLTSSASFYDLNRLEKYDVVKRHFAKPLTDYDVKEIVQDFFPEHLA